MTPPTIAPTLDEFVCEFAGVAASLLLDSVVPDVVDVVDGRDVVDNDVVGSTATGVDVDAVPVGTEEVAEEGVVVVCASNTAGKAL